MVNESFRPINTITIILPNSGHDICKLNNFHSPCAPVLFVEVPPVDIIGTSFQVPEPHFNLLWLEETLGSTWSLNEVSSETLMPVS